MRGSVRGALQRACFIGNHTPRQCGIATFTADAANAVRLNGTPTDVVAINDRSHEYAYPDDVVYQIPEKRISAYRSAADYLNLNDYSVVCLQHEYGIFGGPAGSHILQLLRNLRMPLVTTLHTLLESPSPEQHSVLEEIIQLSQRVIVMTRKAQEILQSQFKVESSRIDLIAHGTPDVQYAAPDLIKPMLGYGGRQVLLTFGLLSPDKGIEYVIDALPALVEKYPDLLYVVLGATHPQVRAQTNDAYRKSLIKRAKSLGVQDHVHFEDRFVELDELLIYLQATDIYITPYLKPQQITSGTLAYAYSCGKPIISTPYWHASELLENGKGILVPFRDSEAIGKSVDSLLGDPKKLARIGETAYRNGRAMTWPSTGKTLIESFQRAVDDSKSELKKIFLPQGIDSEIERPRIDLRHLSTLTDDTGIVQHAFGSVPNRREGYCVDDNARALLVCARLSKLKPATPQLERLSNTYLSYLHHSWNADKSKFRNFMAYDRRWLDEEGSEDSHGRAVWGLGEWVASSVPTELRRIALFLLEESLPVIHDFTSPRAWAYALVGLSRDSSPLNGETYSRVLMRELATRLRGLYEKNRSQGWRWFEEYASYDNPRLSQAMLVAGRALEEPRFIEIGLESLEWLTHSQIGADGVFAPVGSDVLWRQGNPKPLHDQQPLEAWAMVDACLEAATFEKSGVWTARAKVALDWYLGKNSLKQPVVDFRTGGCRDGIHPDRLNDNQGAESTLSYLGAVAQYQAFVQTENWNYVETSK